MLLRPRHQAPGLWVLVVLLSAGCGKEEITVQRVAKETPPAPPGAQPHGGMAPGVPELRWQTPSGWEQAPRSGMSVVQFRASGPGGPAEVSAIALPGVADKDLDVINIFRERLQLAPLDEAALKSSVQPIPVGPVEGRLYDMSAEPSSTGGRQRMLVAVMTREPSSWYFRLTGEHQAVEDQKVKYLEFLKGLSLEKPATEADTQSSSAPTVVKAPDAQPSNGGGDLPEWTVPAGWEARPPGNMISARFAAGETGRQVDITVSVFPGEVGGLVANVNRWRGLTGLAPVPESEVLQQLSVLDMIDGKGQWVDMTGKRGDREERLIGAIVPRGGRTWFYKLVGDVSTAEAEKAAFLKFIQGARHPQ